MRNKRRARKKHPSVNAGETPNPHCSDMLCIVLFFRRRIFLRHIFVHHGFYFPKRMGINLQQGVDGRELSFRFGALAYPYRISVRCRHVCSYDYHGRTWLDGSSRRLPPRRPASCKICRPSV